MAWRPDYITVQELAQYLRIGDTFDNPELASCISTASREIDRMTNRQFGVTDSTEERTYEVRWKRRRARYEARIDDLMTQVGLVVTVSGAAVTNFELRPYNAAQESKPWQRLLTSGATPASTGSGPYTVTVEATWGWTSVPDAVAEATKIQAAKIYHRRFSPFGIAGSPDLGSELRLLAKIDVDADLASRGYRRDYPLV